MVSGEGLNFRKIFGVVNLFGMQQRHRMNLELAGNDEFNPRQADAGYRQLPPAQGAIRHGCIDHDIRAGFRNVRNVDFLSLEIKQAFENLSCSARCTAQRDFSAIREQ